MLSHISPKKEFMFYGDCWPRLGVTNCYYHLSSVINELDGLAKGSREGQYDTMEHAEMVYRGAQETLQFLENEFDSRNSHLKALTSKGSVLDTITYRAEETTDEVCLCSIS